MQWKAEPMALAWLGSKKLFRSFGEEIVRCGRAEEETERP
jgi:hypothetical protein